MANSRTGSTPSFGYSVVENLNTTKQLRRKDSGKLFTLDNTSAFTINLPKLSSKIAGWHCKFIDVSLMAYGLAAAGGTTDDAETVVFREFPMADEAGAVTTGQDGVTIAAATIIGDTIDVITDGTSWFITAMVHEIAHTDDIDAD